MVPGEGMRRGAGGARSRGAGGEACNAARRTGGAAPPPEDLRRAAEGRSEVLRTRHELDRALQREQDLESRRDELELEVARRTEALQRSNEELESALAEKQRGDREREQRRGTEIHRHADETEARATQVRAGAPGFEHVKAATQREPAEQDRDGRQLPPEHDLRKMDAAFARQFDAGEQSGQHESGGQAQHQRKQGPMVGVIAFGLHHLVR